MRDNRLLDDLQNCHCKSVSKFEDYLEFTFDQDISDQRDLRKVTDPFLVGHENLRKLESRD